jgi:hypothetical protein
MTNIEALQRMLPGMVIDTGTLDLVLTNAGLVFNSDYDIGNKVAMELCAIEVLQMMQSAADISEGDMSVRYNKDAIAARIASLQQSAGLTSKPTVRGIRPW